LAYRLVFLIYIFSYTLSEAQNTESPFVTRLQENTTGTYQTENKSSVTAVVLRSRVPTNFNLILSEERIRIPRDPDGPDYSYFLSLPEPQSQVQIESEGDSFEVFLIHSGDVEHVPGREQMRILDGSCEIELKAVPQSEWRAGLPVPSYERAFTEVRHLVVHHSAGSNTNTNYTQVVRDIYLYHTEVNGWSDIGYNFLVAQDGTLYLGRDPDGGDQVTVRGAHFCGRNTGTSGICLLGNYETAIPTQESLGKLVELLTLNVDVLDLDPLASYQHSVGELEAIVGHRDGCATLCPGEFVYEQLPSIRQSVVELAQFECVSEPTLALASEMQEIGRGAEIIFRNLSDGYEEYRWFFEGGYPGVSLQSNNVSVKYFQEGIFDVTLVGTVESQTDTLKMDDLVRVSNQAVEPIVYPNPVSSLEEIYVDYGRQISSIDIYNLSGSRIATLKSPIQSIPTLLSGRYLMYIVSGDQQYLRKIVVR
jgi:hypothetical protein